MRRGVLVLALVSALVAGACESLIDTAAGLALGTQPLRTEPKPPPGVAVACMEALATGVIAADPADPSRVWLEVGDDPDRLELGWPWGTGVRFEPDAAVVAPNGDVVAREGEKVELGGGSIDDVFWVCTVGGRALEGPPDR